MANVMRHLVDSGQGVFHGYPQAVQFLEEDGSWSDWYGNEIFTAEIGSLPWQELPQPPPLWVPGDTPSQGTVVPDPWGRFMCGEKWARGERPGELVLMRNRLVV